MSSTDNFGFYHCRCRCRLPNAIKKNRNGKQNYWKYQVSWFDNGNYNIVGDKQTGHTRLNSAWIDLGVPRSVSHRDRPRGPCQIPIDFGKSAVSNSFGATIKKKTGWLANASCVHPYVMEWTSLTRHFPLAPVATHPHEYIVNCYLSRIIKKYTTELYCAFGYLFAWQWHHGQRAQGWSRWLSCRCGVTRFRPTYAHPTRPEYMDSFHMFYVGGRVLSISKHPLCQQPAKQRSNTERVGMSITNRRARNWQQQLTHTSAQKHESSASPNKKQVVKKGKRKQNQKCSGT